MFVEINGANYNMYSISSFKALDTIVENSDHTQVTKYQIVYVSVSGSTLIENFPTKADRDEKYETLQSEFLVK